VLPTIPLPPPIASSSGPTRTRKTTREGRKYDPLWAAEKEAAKKRGWDQALSRFLTQLHDEGTRSRDVEDYLKGLLGAIRRVKLPPKPDAGESDEDDASVAALSRRRGFFSSF